MGDIASSARLRASSALRATSASTRRGADHVAGVPARRQVGQPHAVERAGSCSTPGRRTGGPSGRPAPATRSRGRTTRWRRPSGCGRGPSHHCRVAWAGAVGLARLDCSAVRQRLAEAGRVEVLEQVGLRCQHPCSSLGDIARRLIHHVSILRGKPPTSHPLPLTGISHARHLRTRSRRRLHAVDVLLITADGAQRRSPDELDALLADAHGRSGRCSGWTSRSGTTTPQPR